MGVTGWAMKKSSRLEVEKAWSTGEGEGQQRHGGACTSSQQPLDPSDQPSLAPAQDSSSIHWPSTGTAKTGHAHQVLRKEPF